MERFTLRRQAGVSMWKAKPVLLRKCCGFAGFDNIPTVPLRAVTPLSQPAITSVQRQVSFARRALANRGMLEAVTWSFMRDADAAHFGGVTDALRLGEPDQCRS